MERLQAALKRAREQRGDTIDRRARAARTVTGQTGGSSSVDQAWEALPQHEFDARLLQRNRIVSYFGQNEATPFDVMRTKIVQQMRTNNWTRVAVTSPTASCGKTTTVANLAFSFARQQDIRTMVIEIDLRRPALRGTLGIKTPQYFYKALAGDDPAEDHMIRYKDNLIVASNQGPATNPAELLQSARCEALLSELEAVYKPDVMLFDTSPLLVSDDTLGFLDNVDAGLLVAAAEETRIEQIDTCERDIAERTAVMGVVLNKCRYAKKDYGYNYE